MDKTQRIRELRAIVEGYQVLKKTAEENLERAVSELARLEPILESLETNLEPIQAEELAVLRHALKVHSSSPVVFWRLFELTQMSIGAPVLSGQIVAPGPPRFRSEEEIITHGYAADHGHSYAQVLEGFSGLGSYDSRRDVQYILRTLAAEVRRYWESNETNRGNVLDGIKALLWVINREKLIIPGLDDVHQVEIISAWLPLVTY